MALMNDHSRAAAPGGAGSGPGRRRGARVTGGSHVLAGKRGAGQEGRDDRVLPREEDRCSVEGRSNRRESATRRCGPSAAAAAQGGEASSPKEDPVGPLQRTSTLGLQRDWRARPRVDSPLPERGDGTRRSRIFARFGAKARSPDGGDPGTVASDRNGYEAPPRVKARRTSTPRFRPRARGPEDGPETSWRSRGCHR